jgi:hypothetical protein
MLMDAQTLSRSVDLATEMVKAGKGGDCIPQEATGGFFKTPISAQRWLSLAAVGGDDDMFSSDGVRMEEVWGGLGMSKVPICVLYSGEDEFVPKEVDKEALMAKWREVVKQKGGNFDAEISRLVVGASHNLVGDADSVLHGLTTGVTEFLQKLGTQIHREDICSSHDSGNIRFLSDGEAGSA